MKRQKLAVLAGCSLGAACWLLLSMQRAPGAPGVGQTTAKTKESAQPVPAYHERAPRKPLPATLPWAQFANPYVANAYFLAARLREILYQQPCYCHCDREFGHGSLLDCYTRPDKHAAVCATCMLETYFAYEESRAGKTVAQIREEIIKGDWKKVRLAQYSSPPRP